MLPTIAPTTTAPPKAAKDVKVLVINGTTTAGAAARVATVLKQGGYNVLRAVDASAQVKATTKASSVYYVTRDFEREAKQIQQDLDLPPTPVTAVPTPPPAPEVNTANVVVVVGPELAKSGGTEPRRRRPARRRPPRRAPPQRRASPRGRCGSAPRR